MADDTPLPCLVCQNPLDLFQGQPGMPNGGVFCTTSGNYGSTVFDSLYGERLIFHVCDDCLTARASSVLYQEASGYPIPPRVTRAWVPGKD